MTFLPEHIAGTTFHRRIGAIGNRFSYGVDYVLIDPDTQRGPVLFSRNRGNLFSVHDRHHGGSPGRGEGAAWAREVLATHGLASSPGLRLLLLTQPSFLGYVFNPVSFWLAFRGDALCAVIAEVNNTFGDRHSYLCHNPDFTPIQPGDTLRARKIFHVSPFQTIAGAYEFGFDISHSDINIRILHENGAEGVVATLAGKRKPLTSFSILAACVRRPAGALRTIILIYWQALKLWLKGAQYTTRPTPPTREVSRWGS